MKPRPAVASAILGLAAVSCAPAGDTTTADPGWVGTITTEGEVTTVVNESGSVWGETATLVEEASIGVDVGDDPYMFGYIHGIYATEDEIFVLDTQVPALRVYDMDGRHLRDIGGHGEGPGEFTYPAWVTGTPDGRVFVTTGGRVNAYTTAGETLASLAVNPNYCCVHPLVVTAEGIAYVPVREIDADTEETTIGLQGFGPDGPVGPLLEPPGIGYEPVTPSVDGRPVWIRFLPGHAWAAAPWGAVVGGVSAIDGGVYRFEIRRFDGARTVVEKRFEPIAVDDDEWDWWRTFAIASIRLREDPGWTWSGAEMPRIKPAFANLISTYSGEVWVTREGPATRVADCVEEITVDNVAEASESPCWQGPWLVDVFDADGRFLGDVELPDSETWLVAQGLFVRDLTVIIWHTGEDGVHRVKRYRLVPPDNG